MVGGGRFLLSASASPAGHIGSLEHLVLSLFVDFTPQPLPGFYCLEARGKMVRGPKKHMKRLNAPSHWMLDKLGGIFVSMGDREGAIFTSSCGLVMAVAGAQHGS